MTSADYLSKEVSIHYTLTPTIFDEIVTRWQDPITVARQAHRAGVTDTLNWVKYQAAQRRSQRTQSAPAIEETPRQLEPMFQPRDVSDKSAAPETLPVRLANASVHRPLGFRYRLQQLLTGRLLWCVCL